MNQVPDSEHIALTCLPGTAIFTVRSLMTNEAHVLPQGMWELEIDDADNESILFRMDPGEDDDDPMHQPRLVKDCLQYKVLRGPGHDGAAQQLVMIKHASGKTIDISLLQRTRQLRSLKLTVDDLTTVQCTAAFLSWPRGGCRIMWSLESVHSSLKLTTYKGNANKWVNNTLATWCSILDKADVPSTVHMLATI